MLLNFWMPPWLNHWFLLSWSRKMHWHRRHRCKWKSWIIAIQFAIRISRLHSKIDSIHECILNPNKLKYQKDTSSWYTFHSKYPIWNYLTGNEEDSHAYWHSHAHAMTMIPILHPMSIYMKTFLEHLIPQLNLSLYRSSETFSILTRYSIDKIIENSHLQSVVSDSDRQISRLEQCNPNYDVDDNPVD